MINTPTFLSSRCHCIPGEDPAEFDALVRDYQRQFSPDGPCERFCLETMIVCDWKRRRLTRVETQLLSGIPEEDQTKVAAAIRQAVRLLHATDRSYFRALRVLQKMQQERRKPAPAATKVPSTKPAVATTANAPAQSPQMGAVRFVSQKTDAPNSVPHYDLGKGNYKPGLVFVG